MPTSGENASPTPAVVPFRPLASAYVRTALMKVTPTSGPIASSSTHHAREAISSRASLRSSQSACLGERKEDLFEIVAGARAARRRQRGQLATGPFAARAPAAQQHEPIADAAGVPDLVNRQEHRAARRRVGWQNARDVAALPQVEAVERLVGEQQRLRHQQADCEQCALAL